MDKPSNVSAAMNPRVGNIKSLSLKLSLSFSF